MNILFITYYFPPSSSSGSFRPFYFARHLRKWGQDITVLTVNPAYYLPDHPLDHDLLSEVGEAMSVVRTPMFRPRDWVIRLNDPLKLKHSSKDAFQVQKDSRKDKNKKSFRQTIKDTITDLLATPDPRIGWMPFAFLSGRKVIKKKRIDILFATASPWTALLLGVGLKSLSKKPLVIDFRDPWVANPNFFRRGSLGRWIDRKLEKFVVKHADSIIANTENLRQDFLRRYSFLRPQQVHTIPNGFEAYQPLNPSFDKNVFTITHTGSLYFSRSPELLLKALQSCIKKGSIEQDKIQLRFIGGMNIDNQELRRLVQSSEIKPILEVIPRVPYSKALEYMESSSVLLVIQPDFPLQIPRKVYDYMAVRKPMLCLTEEQSATWNLIEAYDLGFVCQNVHEDIEMMLESLYKRWCEVDLGHLGDGKCDEFLTSNLAGRLYSILYHLSHNFIKKKDG